MKELLEAALAPAAMFGAGLLSVTALLWRSRGQRAALVLTAGLTLAYFVLAAPLGANALVHALESQAGEPNGCQLTPGAVVIVLAGGVRGRPQREDDFERLSQASVRRLFAGVRLALGEPASRLIVSGGAGGSAREADIMAALAQRLGIDAARIVVDRDSHSTRESASRVPSLVQGMEPLVLVTSALHMPRARAAFERRGARLCPYPVDYQRIRPDPWEWFLPNSTALEKSTQVLHEVSGLAALYLRRD